jgi:uncharacterized protein (TIGR03118 family)
MRYSTRNLQHTVPVSQHKRQSRERRPAVEGLEERALLSAAHDLAVHKHFAIPDDNTANDYEVIPLVSNGYVPAQITDPSLVNPWDINFPQRPGLNPWVWVSDQGTGVATMYKISSDGSTIEKSSLTVTIPTVGSSRPTGPTGVVYNTTKEFSIPGPRGNRVPAEYIFDTLQGTIGGYNPGPHGGNSSAEIMVANNPSTTAYTGLATGTFRGKHYIYAANNIASPGIEVYNDSFERATLPGTFVDPHLPPGFTPYGVRDLGKPNNNKLYVTYRGPLGVGGAIATFTNGGRFVGQIAIDTTIKSGDLQGPYGLDQAPANFGEFSNDILVGNATTGEIDAYNGQGTFKGQLDNPNGSPLRIPGNLLTIHFGAGLGDSGPKIAMLFTAGSDAVTYGLYGMIKPVT